MTTQPHATVRSVSDTQRDVLRKLADGWALEVKHYGYIDREYTLVKAGLPPMLLNSAGTFYALKPYLVPTHNGIGIVRYGINAAGRGVLNSQNGVKQS